jgi:hypothetical protein
MKQKRTAAERMTAAKVAQTIIAKQIENATAARMAALLADDDAAAVRADLELVELRLAAQRTADKIVLLGAALEEEGSHADWPDDIAKAREMLGQMQARLRALNSKPRLDRSAADDAEIDQLVGRVGGMKKHIEMLERMAQ